MLPTLLVGMTMAFGQVPSNPVPPPVFNNPVPASPQASSYGAVPQPLPNGAPPVISYGGTPPQTFSNGSSSSVMVLPPAKIPQAPVQYNSGSTPTTSEVPAQNGNGNGNGDNNGSNNTPQEPGGFGKRFLSGYPMLHEWFPKWLGPAANGDENQPEPARRGLPAPLPSPPMPSGEWQGYPVIGVPYESSTYPLMSAIYQGPWGDEIKQSRVKVYGWVNVSGNWSTSTNSNTPDSYWIVPNSLQMDQFVLRAERLVDSVQTDHISVGFRSTFLYGMDYRYMTAGGWTSYQLLELNNLYGYDLTEQYIDVYFPRIAQGLIMRVGRWIACPDIETQFAPDNYMGTHSILFTFDTYTQTGIMFTLMLNDQWQVQGAIHAGTDMAPWYPGAEPTGMFGIRWVSRSNNDSVYLVLNDINDGQFRYFIDPYTGKLEGHDNFQYVVGTWQHKFNDRIHTKTEAYYMWQFNAVVGGTPSFGPTYPYGGGGGFGAPIPGTSRNYGVVNYTMFHLSKKDFLTIRNEWWRDEEGERSGFAGNYTSHTIGITHNVSSNFQIRPEVGYYRNWDQPAFDLGTKQYLLQYGFDATLRF
ncbi:MAG TPA: outer membrane beta-barrel protein [Gemmataceae bacterium]|nr:outer membrane beta-barrel protein [Gemmataceae bacterium]